MLRPVDYASSEPQYCFLTIAKAAPKLIAKGWKELCIPTNACISKLQEMPRTLCTVQGAQMVGKEDSRVVIVATGRVHCLGSENKREAAWASLLQPWAGHDYITEGTPSCVVGLS